MSVTLENALVVPFCLKEKFELFLVANGVQHELNLNKILPFTGERTEVNLMNFWGIAENPVISETATFVYLKDLDDITHMVYHFETESLSSETLGALALAIGGKIEYYHFDHHGDFYHHCIYEFFEAKDGQSAYYKVEDFSNDIDAICDFLFDKCHEEHLFENCV